MAVDAVEPVVATYEGDGATVTFPTPGAFGEPSDISVRRITVATDDVALLQFGVDYTVLGGGGAAGNVVLASGALAPAGTYIEVSRVTPRTQPDRFRENQGIPARTLEARLDDIVRVQQEIDERLSRALVLPRGISPVQGSLPRGPRAGRFLTFDEDGRPIYGSPVDLSDFTITEFGEQVLTKADAAELRALIGAQASINPSAVGISLVQQPDAAAIRTFLGIQAKASLFVTDFGAVPGLGNDNTQAFTNGMAAVSQLGGGVLLVPPGVWEIQNEAYCATSNVVVMGYGSGSVIVNGSANKAALKFGAAGNGPQWYNNGCVYLTFVQKPGLLGTPGNCGVRISGQGKFLLSDCRHDPFILGGNHKNGDPFFFDDCSDVWLVNIRGSDAASNGVFFNNVVGIAGTNIQADANGGKGLNFVDCAEVSLANVRALGNASNGLYIGETGVRLSRQFTVTGCVFGGNGSDNVEIAALRQGTFNGCWAVGHAASASASARGIAIVGNDCRSITFYGGGALASKGNGVKLANDGAAPQNVQFFGFAFGDDAIASQGNGLGGTGYGLSVEAGTTGQAIGGSAKNNATGAIQNNSGGTFTTSNVIT